MDIAYYDDIDRIRKTLVLVKYENEYNYLNSQEQTEDFIASNNARINYLKTQIEITTQERKNIKSVEDKKNDITDNLSEFVFKKPWTRLPEYHKKIKLNEYVESQNLDKENKKILLNKLLEMMKNKELNKKTLTYDPETTKIIEIKLKIEK